MFKKNHLNQWIECVQSHQGDFTQVLNNYIQLNKYRTNKTKNTKDLPVLWRMISQLILINVVKQKMFFTLFVFQRQWLHLFPVSLNVKIQIWVVSQWCAHTVWEIWLFTVSTMSKTINRNVLSVHPVQRYGGLKEERNR